MIYNIIKYIILLLGVSIEMLIRSDMKVIGRVEGIRN